jgi:hypothetical protein
MHGCFLVRLYYFAGTTDLSALEALLTFRRIVYIFRNGRSRGLPSAEANPGNVIIQFYHPTNSFLWSGAEPAGQETRQ